MRLAAAAALVGLAASAAAEEATFTVKTITPEAAMKAGNAALARCRAEGFQVTVAVVDRSGVLQALVRDRFASPGSVELAQSKARTSANFRMDTAALDRELQPGKSAASLRGQPNITAIPGGVAIQAGGSLAGAIGVSGAPGPMNDDLCARAGLRAIAEDLEF